MTFGDKTKHHVQVYLSAAAVTKTSSCVKFMSLMDLYACIYAIVLVNFDGVDSLFSYVHGE